ncbi:MAG: mycofactocin-associated electron transfer flavoprotein beta subunit [Ilumatobacteraceae bacterium]
MIVVCWKWIAVDGDERWAGVSDADRAALETGLRLAEPDDDAVTVVTVGGPGAALGLRAALAAGARRAVRIDAPEGLSSRAVAAAIAEVADGATWVLCGDVSADRGTGSVPAFLAAELGAVQALGLVGVDVGAATDGHGERSARVIRRLDGGRREVLDVVAPAVLSVEGSVARLRRASLPAEVAARTAPVEDVVGPRGPVDATDVVQPYRPRARAFAAPSGEALDRVRLLTDPTAGAGGAAAHELVTLEPGEAAARILEALAGWGYLLP